MGIGNRTCRCFAPGVCLVGDGIRAESAQAIDGTPVLDTKPVLKGFLPRGEIVEPVWTTEIMKDYW